MSRLTQPTSKIIALVVAVLVIAGGASYDVAIHHQTPPTSSTVKLAPTTQLTYRGQEGKNALELLKQHAKIQTKSSAGLGEYVTAINGNDGGGKKYWILYVNGKESQVGAGAYVTHNNDVIKWKLQ